MKRMFQMVIGICLACLLTGCGEKPPQESVESSVETTPAPTPLQEFDWKTESWKPFEETTEGKQMSVIEYIPFDWEEPDFAYKSEGDTYTSFGGDLYLFRRYWLEDGVRYFLYRMDGDTREVTCQELDKEKAGLTDTNVSNIQLVSEEEMVFFTMNYVDKVPVDCCAVHVSMDGEFLYETSLFDFYEEYAPFQESPFGGIMAPIEPFFDSKGNSYYYDSITSRAYKIDKEGNVTTVLDYSSDKKVSIIGKKILLDGSVALLVSDNNTWEGKLLWMDGEGDTPKQLAAVSRAYFGNVYVGNYGMFYYVSNDKLYRWNIRTGECRQVFSFQENNITSLQYVLMEVNSKGEVLLYQYSGDEMCAYVLSEEGIDIAAQKQLTVASLIYDNSYLKGCAASYSRKHPGTLVTCEATPEEIDAARTRILADITSGSGPDMLWVTMEDMRVLQEKGALCNLEELISEESLAEIFPGIIESGTIDGEYVGLIIETYPTTMFTADSTWAEGSWGALDILEILENKEELEGMVWSGDNTYSGKSVLYRLVCYDMTDSPFIDFEKGESRFEREEFVRLLELTKQYDSTQPEGNAKNTQSGQFLARESYIWSISTFCQLMREMGEECHLVGMPSETDYIGNWTTASFLVVNKNSPYKEEIAGYLEELLCLQNQRQVPMNSIRRDVIEESMVVPEWSDTPQYKTAAGTYTLLEAKPDGTPYFEEYLDFLENCGPMPYRVEAIGDIVDEEIEGFYDGTQSAEKTAENIDRRVQLYLDERK